ncbi:MAG: major capsid protein [Lachnospiraceae bacterium]|nr:major capsid protein [Lachnospiraceae bacterium]
MAEQALDFFSSHMLTAALEQVESESLFFHNRYFPTGAGDIFNSDKVLVEIRKGSRKMAPFVGDRIDAIPIERRGYEMREIEPARIAVQRTLTLDDLRKRGFGEALYSYTTPAQRAARLEIEDMTEMNRRISRREEWICVQTMINNACEMQEMVDAQTVGDTKYAQFFENDPSEHKFITANPWNSGKANIVGDVAAMCSMLTRWGMNPTDLVIGPDIADLFYNDDKICRLLDKNLAISFGSIDEKIEYPGVSILARNLNFRGHPLTVFVVSNSYEDEKGNSVPYFPSDGVMVTFPSCGHMMYGRVDQMPYGSIDFRSVAAKRVAKFFCDNMAEIRGLRLQTKPIAAPKTYCPYIFAPGIVA